MKKLLKLVSTLTICLAVNSVALAATTFKDVKGTKYEEAIGNLIEVGLVNGFDDNTYRPAETVTRAQMAKLLVIASGQEGDLEAAKKKTSSFPDMKSSHWAYGYINIATDMKLINGYLDGTFAPDDKVSFAEATAMILRALGYENDVMKSTETWPNNYISYAKKLSLYDSVGTINSTNANNGADRGNVALLLWNMLRTGVCTVTGQTSNGLIYGQGIKMLNKYTKFNYFNDIVIKVNKFDSDYENATVIYEDKDAKVSVSLTDDDVLKYFGRKVDVLYNTSTKKTISIDIDDTYKSKNGSITQTPTSKKLYVDSATYTMPSSDNILYYKIDDMDDAVEATMILDGSSVKAVILQGATSVQLGLVTDNDVTVSKKDGIKLKKKGSSTATSYALIDEDDIPDEGSVILYYLNSDNEIGIIKEIDSDDAYTISSLTTTKIKLNGKTYTYDSSSFEVVEATSSSLKTLAFKSIDDEEDLAYVIDYGGISYLVVFTGAANSAKTQKEAYDDLKNYIKTAEAKESKEASYSQATFVPYLEALKNARSMTSNSTLSKITSAHTKLQDAYTALKSVSSTSTEGKIAKARAELRALVNGTAANVIKDRSLYTTTSYSTFNTKYTSANNLLSKTNTTLDEVNNAKSALQTAINNLVKAEETQEHKDAVKRLDDALAKCKDIAESIYTQASLNAYHTAKTKAESVKSKSATESVTEINSAANALEDAINKLVVAKDELINELNALLIDCEKNIISKNSTYMPDTYNKFKDAFDAAYAIDTTKATSNDISSALKTLQDEKDALVTRLEVLEESISIVNGSKIKNATEVKNLNLGTASSYNDDDKVEMISKIQEAVKTDLENLILSAQAFSKEQGLESDGELETATGNALKVLNDSESELEDWAKAYDDLIAFVNELGITL